MIDEINQMRLKIVPLLDKIAFLENSEVISEEKTKEIERKIREEICEENDKIAQEKLEKEKELEEVLLRNDELEKELVKRDEIFREWNEVVMIFFMFFFLLFFFMCFFFSCVFFFMCIFF